MLAELMEEIDFVERKIQRLEAEIATKADVEALARIATIPGIDLITAWTMLAELGSDMSVFASLTCGQLGRLCPATMRAAGKRLSNRTRKGNVAARALCQAAWAATRKKNSYIAAFFYRKAGKHGIRKAIVAMPNRLLIIAFCILRDRSEYHEPGDN